MQQLIKGLIFLSMLSLFSCTRVLYTQKQVMESYKTKQDVVKRFGTPAERKISDGTEEWLYIYNEQNSTDTRPVFETNTVAEFGRYKSYVMFSFDKSDNVVHWDARGADFSKKKVSAGRTIGLVAGICAVVFGLLLILGGSATNHMSW